jgi:hypothetical protein
MSSRTPEVIEEATALERALGLLAARRTLTLSIYSGRALPALEMPEAADAQAVFHSNL